MTDSTQPISTEPFDEAVNAKISECRTIFLLYFKQMVEHFFRRLDDAIVPYFRKADAKWQEEYFDFLHFMRGERNKIEHCFIEAVIREFDGFWRSCSEGELRLRDDSVDLNRVDLMEEDAREEDYAIASMVRHSEQILRGELRKLDRFFAGVLGETSLDRKQNPIAPAKVCHAFAAVLETFRLSHKHKAPIYKVFDKLILGEIGVVYRALYGLSWGSRPADYGFDAAVATEKGAGAGVAPSDKAGRLSDLEAFSALQSALVKWRETRGRKSEAAEGVYEYHEVLRALTAMQRAGAAEMLNGVRAEAGTTSLRPALLAELRSRRKAGDGRLLAGMEEDVIDLVSMIFGAILTDDRFPEPVRFQIGRLQIPAAKVGILDKSLFFRDSHPLRRLMNALIEAAAQAELRGGSEEVDRKIRETVDRILGDFELYAGLFSERLEEFAAFVAGIERRRQRAEERCIRFVESREKLHAAKRGAEQEIRRRTFGKPLPDFIGAFLNDVWKDVLVLAFLRREIEPDGGPEALSLTDRLIASVLPPENAEEKKRILAMVPSMIHDLRAGLKRISYDKHLRSKFFKELAVFHVILLNQERRGEAGEREYSLAAARKSGAAGETLSDASFPENRDGRLAAVRNEEKRRIEEIFGKGHWYDFAGESGERVRAKLAWTRPDNGAWLFVDGEGAKFAEKSLFDLSEDLRLGRVKAIKAVETPVVDNAFAALLRTLKFFRPLETDNPFIRGDERGRSDTN